MLGILFFMFRMEEYIVQSTVILHPCVCSTQRNGETGHQRRRRGGRRKVWEWLVGWLVDLVIVPFLCIKDSAAAAAALI